ncbi:MAG: dihydrofolate reductase [Opitutales bacterium]|nr:dihydrofolate reductase [Opitutales bacterium]
MPDSLAHTNVSADKVRSLNWKAIAAMSENRVIGKDGQLPWHLPEDFKWVKTCTKGQAIAMGRKTFESMGRALPGRTNIVLSRRAFEHADCVHLASIDALEDYQSDREIWIFGGAEIYRQSLTRTADLYLTVVRGEFAGDAFFPEFEDWFDCVENVRDEPEFSILHYRNRLLRG